jgi:hypothetical protein
LLHEMAEIYVIDELFGVPTGAPCKMDRAC